MDDYSRCITNKNGSSSRIRLQTVSETSILLLMLAGYGAHYFWPIGIGSSLGLKYIGAAIGIMGICIVVFVSRLFSACHESRAAEKAPVPLRDPLPQTIKKGDIIVAAVKRFRLPQSKDSVTGGTTTNAYARIQYLKPIGDDSGRVAVGNLRGTLYLADRNGEHLQLYLDHRSYPLSFDASMMPNETGFAGFAFHPEFSMKGRPGFGKLYTAFSARSGSGEANYLNDDGWVRKLVPFKGQKN